MEEEATVLTVVRGGGWNNNANKCRSANRNRNTPSKRNNNNGFRPVVSPFRRPLMLSPRLGAQTCQMPRVQGLGPAVRGREPVLEDSMWPRPGSAQAEPNIQDARRS